MSGGQSKLVQAEGNEVAPCCIFRLWAQIPKTYLYYLTSGGILPCAQFWDICLWGFYLYLDSFKFQQWKYKLT